MLGFIPLYLFNLDAIPFQVSSDEIVVTTLARQESAIAPHDVFGLMPFFGLPRAAFLILGWLGRLLGGVTIWNLRVIHAWSGVLTILIGYLFFRSFLSRRLSVAAAVLLACNHTFLGVSRMATRLNTTVLIELGTLALLIRGLERRNVFFSFLGGLMAGTSFYVHFPARALVGIWTITLILFVLKRHRQVPRRIIGAHAAVSFLACGLVAVPLLVATAKGAPETVRYMREQLLIFPEGRQAEQQWVAWWPGKSLTITDAVRYNIRSGLTMFNDQGASSSTANYHHPGHACVDPLTGVFLWLGFLAVLGRRREPLSLGELSCVAGFVSLWLAFAFLVTKAPDYDRLPVILPFVSCLAVCGMDSVAGFLERWRRRLRRVSAPLTRAALFVGLVASAAAWNLGIYWEYAQRDIAKGDPLGATVRYMEARTRIAPYTFWLISDEHRDPYFDSGKPSSWNYWLLHGTAPAQASRILSPEEFSQAPPLNPPFTLFLSRPFWTAVRGQLIARYPTLTVHPLMPDASRLAVEVY